MLTFSAINFVPALPGKQYNLFILEEFDILSAIECSLPPLPRIAIFIYLNIYPINHEQVSKIKISTE